MDDDNLPRLFVTMLGTNTQHPDFYSIHLLHEILDLDTGWSEMEEGKLAVIAKGTLVS